MSDDDDAAPRRLFLRIAVAHAQRSDERAGRVAEEGVWQVVLGFERAVGFRGVGGEAVDC